MSWKSNIKTALKASPAVFAADLVKDVIDPKTDVIPGVGRDQDPSRPGNVPSANTTIAGSASPSGNTGYQGSSGAYQGSNAAYAASQRAAAQEKADTLGFLNDQEGNLRGLLGMIGQQRDQGLTAIGDDFDRESSRANERQSQALQGYATQREDTNKSKLEGFNKVNTNARTGLQSLQRILGMAAGTGSSAFKIAAPGAVSRDATMRRNDVNETYGQNLRDIDTAENNTKISFKNLLDDLLRQRKGKESDLLRGINQQEQEVYGDLADVATQRAQANGGNYAAARAAAAPYQAEINNRKANLANIFNQYRTPYTVQDVKVETPDLKDYTVDRAELNAQQASGVSGDNSPYSQFLKRRQAEGGLI